MKVQKFEFDNFFFQYLNAHWLVYQLPVASIRGPEGKLTQRNEKVKNQ